MGIVNVNKFITSKTTEKLTAPQSSNIENLISNNFDSFDTSSSSNSTSISHLTMPNNSIKTEHIYSMSDNKIDKSILDGPIPKEHTYSIPTPVALYTHPSSSEHTYSIPITITPFGEDNQNFEEHDPEKKVNEGRALKCNSCTRYFSTYSQLEIHSRIHAGGRPYKCDLCEKSFTKKSYFKAHSDIHSVKRKYECIICQKTFAQRASLIRHRKLHTKKPFSFSSSKNNLITNSDRDTLDKNKINPESESKVGDNKIKSENISTKNVKSKTDHNYSQSVKMQSILKVSTSSNRCEETKENETVLNEEISFYCINPRKKAYRKRRIENDPEFR